MKRHSLITAATAAVASAALVGSAVVPGAAAAPAEQRTLAKDLLSPLSVAVAGDGTVWFSQNFAGTLMRKRPGGKARAVHQAKGEGTEVGAVSTHGRSVTFATTEADGDTFLMRRSPRGKVRKVANLSRFEKRRNPDRRATYGLRGIGPECAAEWPAEEMGPATYRGIVESHPYATLVDRGRTYVADAAANAVLTVRPSGRVRTLAVLPGIPYRITEGFASGAGLPDCVVGKRYWFEPVPTDVEEGPGGRLYVTALPGGPEDPSLGARGAVFRVNPHNGRVRKVASGLMSPTGLAVADNGTMFVAELFGGRIAKVRPHRRPRTFAKVEMPGDVELDGRRLVATTHVLTGMSGEPGDVPAGRVVRFRR